MVGKKEKRGGETFYRSVAVGTMTLEGGEVEEIESTWGWAVAAGVIMAVIGVFAMVYPVVTSVGVVFALGIALVVGALAQLVYAFTAGKVSGFLWHVLVAMVYALIGTLVLVYPLSGLATLTLLLAAYFLVSGLSKIVIAFESMETRSWGWMLVSGILSLILGVLVWTAWPVGSLWFIGLIVGIDLFFAGISLAITATSVHSLIKEEQAESMEM